MAIDPADSAASVDALGHDHQDVEGYASLAADLRELVDGDLRVHEQAQVLYTTKGIIYQARPEGVFFPTGIDDVCAAVETAGTISLCCRAGRGRRSLAKPSDWAVSCST